jgi:multidrug resistance protein MdtO
MTTSIDQGASSFLAFLRDELAPSPGRLSNVLRITALTVLVVVTAESFRIPLPAYSAYIVFFASKEEAASTTLTGVILTVAATLSIFAALVVYMISAGEPGLRLPLMAGVALTGLFLSRISPLGPAAFATGFVMTVALTLIDVIPPTAPLPPGEILTQTVLWLWVVVMLPIGAVVLANLLTGRDPDTLFRQILAERLEMAGRLFLGAENNVRSEQILLRSGPAAPLRYLKLAGLGHRHSPQRIAADRALIARSGDIMALAAEWQALGVAEPALTALAEQCGKNLLSAARVLLEDQEGNFPEMLSSRLSESVSHDEPKESFLLQRVQGIVAQFPELLAERRSDHPRIPTSTPSVAEPRRLLVADAFSNPEHVRFALKTTLAVMIAYFAYNLLDWPDIRTAMITCFFVTFGNVGETVHRMTLRLAGALIGGGLGLASVVFLMPVLTSVTDLCLLIGVVAFIAGWIATSSDRLAYAGMQMAMAFFLCVLVGTGPHVDLAVARDRVVGILLGNLIVFLVFSTVWPVSVVTQAREGLAMAVGKLVELLRASSPTDEMMFAFDDALMKARRLQSFDSFEPHRLQESGTGAEEIGLLRLLKGPVVILEQAGETAAYREGLAEWLSWNAHRMTVSNKPIIADPEEMTTGQTAWCRELNKRALRFATAIQASGDVEKEASS